MIKLKRFQVAQIKNKSSFTTEVFHNCGATSSIGPKDTLFLWGPRTIEHIGDGLIIRIKTTSSRRINQAEERIKVLEAENTSMKKALKAFNNKLELIPRKDMKVYLLTSGSGDDGDEWSLISIHRSMKGAMKAKAKYEELRTNKDGSTYTLDANEIEVWTVYE